MASSKTTSAKPTVVQWPIHKLKSHPRQNDVFDDLPPSEYAALLGSMQRSGQDHPIHMLPDGTILAGHQRVRAARELGWSHIAAIVRHDLEPGDKTKFR